MKIKFKYFELKTEMKNIEMKENKEQKQKESIMTEASKYQKLSNQNSVKMERNSISSNVSKNMKDS